MRGALRIEGEGEQQVPEGSGGQKRAVGTSDTRIKDLTLGITHLCSLVLLFQTSFLRVVEFKSVSLDKKKVSLQPQLHLEIPGEDL